eukprot:m.23393 g.23393  ORF g.23393 m.23393 type:complete len:377 (-) comp14200_c0_seq1:517-1647(-)
MEGQSVPLDVLQKRAITTGWMHKLGGIRKNRKLRFFYLDHDCIYYYETPDAPSPKGRIELLTFANVDVCTGDEFKPFTFKLFSDNKAAREWYLTAASQQDMDKWVTSIENTMSMLNKDQLAIYDEPVDDRTNFERHRDVPPPLVQRAKSVTVATPTPTPPHQTKSTSYQRSTLKENDTEGQLPPLPPSGFGHRTSIARPSSSSPSPPSPPPKPRSSQSHAAERGTAADHGFDKEYFNSWYDESSTTQRNTISDEDLYQCPIDDVIFDCDFFWKNTSREQAEVILDRHVGSFLVRQGREGDPLVVSGFWEGAFRHYKVFDRPPKGFYLHKNHDGFESVMQLIHHYRSNELPPPSAAVATTAGQRILLNPFTPNSFKR